MIKGCRRNMILLKNLDSDTIEEAYFVLREGNVKEEEGAEKMIEEANRILSGAVIVPAKRKRETGGDGIGVLLFLLGALLGAAAGMLLLYFL